MEKKQLQEIYSFGKITPAPKDPETFLNIPIDNQWFALPLNKLTATEIQLLTKLYLNIAPVMVNEKKHPWYSFLFDHKSLDYTTGTYRVIQFSLLNTLPQEDRIEWLDAFASMFNELSDYFFVTDTYGLLIEEKHDSNYSLEELEGIILTLETDFMCKAKAFLGSYLTVSDGFPRFFQEEKNIFLTELPGIKSQSAFSLSQVALHYFTNEAIEQSLIMQIFSKKLTIDAEMTEIITVLWRNQGNISSTAKELFMHRNTLQYRLEKYHEQTGLSLKNMDDLVLSYLLVA